MNKSKSIYALALGLMLAPVSAVADNVAVTVRNSDNVQRQELVEIPVNDVYAKLGIGEGKPFIVKNALGQQVAYQVTYDGKLLVDASVRPGGTAEFTIMPGTPKPMKTFVCGKQYPERVDDIAWENDRTAYRVYGPALQRTGEKAYGIDVWVKNTPDLEVEKRYNTELSNHPKIEELKRSQDANTERLKIMEESQKKLERNKLRDRILQSYRYFTDKDRNPAQTWNRMEAEAFWELIGEYEKRDGDGYVHTVVIPAMNLLTVVEMNELLDDENERSAE